MFWIFSGIAFVAICVFYAIVMVKASKETTGTDDIDDPWDFGY